MGNEQIFYSPRYSRLSDVILSYIRLVAVPCLSEPHFMEGHYIATQMGLLPRKNVIVRTIDTGGAGPITGLLEADRMIRTQGCDLVALVAGI